MNKSNIKEANEHLQKLYQRVQDLESTVQEQAEAMMRRDEEAESTLRELGRSKDREIAELRRSLESSEMHVQHLLGSCREKDSQISFLKQRSKILDDVCQELPSLEILVDTLRRTPSSRSRHASDFEQGVKQMTNATAEHGRQSASPDVRPTGFGHSSPRIESTPQHNMARNFSISDDDEEHLS
ncbi:vimentin-type intermediate filament-associated coiled-coil protein-like [Asterias rubens]|uniref:vimentin-type intermediate filament-associated coiled-coil protein-like n=1 Tax=Asterias rubens TaxID=7604 RepID=UPI0014552385|nr:vimentin-type intermediate filament-associated coiled-coil protein-like [Asterias rubens]